MEPGFYYLRASPAVSPIGGMYATSEGSDTPVRVAARVPPLEDRQIWRVDIIPSPGMPLKAHIILAFSDLPVVMAWSLRGERPIPEDPVMLSQDVSKHVTWDLEKIDNGIEDAWTLRAETTTIGVHWYAGTSPHGEVIFKVLPIGVPVEEKPYWVFTPARRG
ncbi:hypothetical protein PHLGIDRAFT_459588 [Phlebiopsis gigantea 11061_1 CR5-6]|uniref:Uncharacterized protein n=1 Tax=Phlebiopsis gigantea (strain 11061_1 CR5-6) TaxID=745531 RepID=A0A0C3S9U2_PHLG1|nr:hypothetical protein PHLGIDRAFT_459588 [Phlebiopsis gigantea 11061_1 CR5-6]